MKKSHFLMSIGLTALGLVLAGGVAPALATPTSLSFFSDYQTYVISGTQANANSGGIAYADTVFYGKGAMMISAAKDDTVNGTYYSTRTMDSLFSFNTASNVTGSVGSYAGGTGFIGMDIASAYNNAYGAGNWSITGVTVSLASNWRLEGNQPNNPDFNKIASGLFTFELLGGDPDITTTTWNTLMSYLPTTTQTSVGTFQWNALTSGTDGSASYALPSHDLTVTQDLIDAILSGEFTLLGVAADDQVGYVFNTKNRWAPMITITADLTPAPVPIPAAAWLFGPGLAGIAFLRRRVFGA